MIGRIYKLTDPLTKKALYVGSTKRPLAERLKEHVYSIRRDNTPVYDFLHGNNILPFIELLEEVEVVNSKELRDREIYWIEKLTLEGEKLFNPNKVGKFSGSIRVDWNLFSIVKKYCRNEGISIGRFYDIAAKERLKHLKIIEENHSFPSEK